MSKWLDVIGVPEAGAAALSTKALALVQNAEVVIGIERRLNGLDLRGKEVIVWDGALAEMVAKIVAAGKRATALLASGDPNWFGIGATLSRHLIPEEFAMHPSPSSFQLAAARLHWPLQNVACISLHGRPVSTLNPHVLPRNRVLALTSDRVTLSEVAEILRQRGYAQSRLTVLENLGSGDERLTAFAAAEADAQDIGDFYVLAIDCVTNIDASLLPPVPGLPDDIFLSDGQLTKRDVRAATLAKLAPFPGALLWDVGAGCGSVGIEWMRAARDAKAICFERDPERLQMIVLNKGTLGVPGLETVGGEAPGSLVGQMRPDAIFHGGDVGNDGIFDACWAALGPCGRLVANAVTLEGEAALVRRQKLHGGELTRIEVSVLDAIGSERVLRPRMAVMQWLAIKGAAR